MSRPLVYIADLRHDYQGFLTSDAMPLGIGYMKAVMDRDFAQAESLLFLYPEKLAKALEKKIPNVFMITNYVWNESLSYHFAKIIKEKSPETLVIAGGPNIAQEDTRKITYLKNHPYLDLYVYGEGDFLATELVENFVKSNYDIERFLDGNYHSSVYKKASSTYLVTPIKPRERDLDQIPSPWLTGVMDEFFDGKLAPLFETNRGCPFTCTFCVQGSRWYTKVNNFSLSRIKKEIEYIGAKIEEKCPDQKVFRIADSNYGMFERDIVISEYLGEAQKKYNYPLFIDATTGKNKADIIIKSLEKVNGAIVMYQAVQSLDEGVLENIKRKNIKLDAYEKIQIHVRGRGLRSSSDLILGLPGETLKSHLMALEKLVNSGTQKLNNFQSMLLKGSELENYASREKFKFRSKFRLMPKCFGDYGYGKVFDVEEIVVSTSSLQFEDYITARQYHFVISVFWNDSRFEPIITLLKNAGIQPWRWIESIVKQISNVDDFSNDIFQSYTQETKEELFNSKEELEAFYADSLKFEQLKNNEIGDNVIYKYKSLALFLRWNDICSTACLSAESLIRLALPQFGWQKTFKLFWSDLFLFLLNRQVNGLNKEAMLSDSQVKLNYNIGKWIDDLTPLEYEEYKFESNRELLFFLNTKRKSNLNSALSVWSEDVRAHSMLVRRIAPEWQIKDYVILSV